MKRTIYIETPCHLKCSNSQLVICYSKIKGLESYADKTVPIEDIGILILEHHQITLTHYLLDILVTNNVAVITSSENHLPTGMFMPLDGHYLQSERFRAQILATEPLKKQLWQQTIIAKISNQAKILKKWGGNEKTLLNLAKDVKSGDIKNNEAIAAYYYWKNIFPQTWQFVRHREGPPPNNLLNYGYSILRASMARAIVGAGLLPTLGIFHRNRYNAYCLADDIMEPYRPFVDDIVRTIIYQTSSIETLTKELKIEILKISTVDVILAGNKSPLMVAMQFTANSLAKCYRGEIRKISYPGIL